LTLETGHIDDPARVSWMEDRRESAVGHDSMTRSRALATVVKAETFERFMAMRFPGKKRFGSEGAESLYALIQRVLDRAVAAGVREVVVGTMHRGRLGLMSHSFGQPLQQLFARMKGAYPMSASGQAADVPYHLGLVGEYVTPAGRLTLRLLPNPSRVVVRRHSDRRPRCCPSFCTPTRVSWHRGSWLRRCNFPISPDITSVAQSI
jgi:2-oxoglutarate dehydrogenase E1 component